MKFSSQQHLIVASLFCLALCLFPYLSYALSVQDIPNPQQVNGTWVTDMANILSDSTETKLNQMISELESKNGTEIAVVTVPETTPSSSPKAFTTELFNHWGIGKADEDNGVLFLVSVGDRRVEIETGYGIEPILPDAKVGNIIENQITPRFKEGDFNGGVLAGTNALVSVLYSSGTHAIYPVDTISLPQRGAILLINICAILLSWFEYHQFKKISTPILLKPMGRSRLHGVSDPKQRAYLIAYIGIVLATLSLGLLLVVISPKVFGLKVAIGWLIFSVIIGFPIAILLTNKYYVPPSWRCSDCGLPLKKVRPSLVPSFLTKPEKVARNLGSVKFEGWECRPCSQKMRLPLMHIRAYVVDSRSYIQCPICQELTMKHSETTITSPTEYSTGERRIIDDCKCCDYYTEKTETIPSLTSTSDSSSSNSSSSDSSSSSSSDFGGGDSGGGGAGGDW
ncbi:MAG: TPM domain-containing protein [Coleofasciculus sp. G3-WIS-01]|uniref:TPM domain-containing protein n=1 Tax=Coleofasciculus sp. G3-WIS-01 TaxID=3069528 RepID=UPI0032F8333A